MEVLRLEKWRARALVPVALLFLTAAGCALAGLFGGGAKPFAFSHKLHVGEQSLECADCHRGADSADQPGMPALGQCKLCHTKIDADKPPERQVTLLFDGKDYLSAHASRLPGEVRFSHKQHAAGPVKCAECHQGIETNDVVDHSVAVRMDDCMKCHTARGTANQCATCHTEIGITRPPSNHDRMWQQRHGQVVRAHTAGTANQCGLCHQESACTKCHLDVPPKNHDNYFRLRGHGQYARLDRQQCAACHRSDSCDSCHRETRPITHAGAWGAPRDNHCLGCHFPLQSNNCVTCHKATPSHQQATPLPPNHNPAMNCRQCHGLTAPLPHVDKGDQCIQCHR
jgi:hypothetical protein